MDFTLFEMYKIPNTCYMCNAPKTSGEHVPPKCLFPEKKDLGRGVDLRKELSVVPSCDCHNSKKCKNDEYLLFVLTGTVQINEVGREMYRTKVRRAISRNSSILRKIASTVTPAKFNDPFSGEPVESLGFEVDPDRFNSIIDKLSRAIYFFHFKEKWTYGVKYQAEFFFATANQSDDANSRHKEITKQADEWFSNAAYYGDNPEVFKYQVLEADNSRKMRLHFYEGCKLLLIFNRHPVL